MICYTSRVRVGILAVRMSSFVPVRLTECYDMIDWSSKNGGPPPDILHSTCNLLDWLTFACNANDVETANDLVEPPMKMPPLKECAIRLADDPTKANLQQLASHVKLETTKLFPGSSFRFMNLPDELQLQVPESSYLILPNPVYCLPQPGL